MSPRTQLLLIFSGLSPSDGLHVMCGYVFEHGRGICPDNIRREKATIHLCASFLGITNPEPEVPSRPDGSRAHSRVSHGQEVWNDLVGLKLATGSGTKMAESFQVLTAFELQGKTHSPGVPGF